MCFDHWTTGSWGRLMLLFMVLFWLLVMGGFAWLVAWLASMVRTSTPAEAPRHP